MKQLQYLFIALLLCAACNNSQQGTAAGNHDNNTVPPHDTAHSLQEPVVQRESDKCNEGVHLVYENETFATYTEDRMRGAGVVLFTLDVNDRLDILYEDEAEFGSIVLNQDLTFFTVTMPKKITARNVVPNYDFAAFEFDAEDVNKDKEYLIIYANRQKLYVKKEGVKYSFVPWDKYLKDNILTLKQCNLLRDGTGEVIANSKEQAFKVTAVKGDSIHVQSVEGCAGSDVPFIKMEGWLPWKKDNVLTVNFAGCL